MGTAALYALVPAAALLVATAIALVRPAGPTARAVIQHLGAGVVFAIVGVELLPDLLEAHAPGLVAAGVAGGTALMVGLRAATDRLAAGGRGSLVGATVLDVAVDGLLLGVGFALGARQGQLLALGLAVEFGSIGLATGAALVGAGWARRAVLALATGLGVLLVAAAVLGAGVLGAAGEDAQALAVAVGSVALLYLVTEELLTEAHEGPERPWYTAVFFAGFLVVFLVETAA